MRLARRRHGRAIQGETRALMRLSAEKAEQAHQVAPIHPATQGIPRRAAGVAGVDRDAAGWHCAHMDRLARSVNVLRIAPGSLLLGTLLLAGCSGNWSSNLPGADMFDAPRTVRGIVVADEALAQITPGVTARADVQALLGSPSATGTFADDDWFYISGVTRQRPGRTFAMEQQQVVLVRFDGRGIVEEVRRVGPEARRDVRFVQRETPSPGTERTFMQRLLGNIGRLGPGVPQSATGPGAASPGQR